MKEEEPMVVIPYVAGLSEDTRQVCSRFGIRTVFRSGQTLQNHLSKVKDHLHVPDLNSRV